MTFQSFLKIFDQHALGELAGHGFRRTGAGQFVRLRGEEINVIWLQGKSSGDACCVNLGMHYSFIPELGSLENPDGDKIEQPGCEIQTRLAEDPSANDQWWPLTGDAARVIASLLIGRGLSIFNDFALSGGILNIKPGELASGLPALLQPMTRVRAALLLARIHEHRCSYPSAVEFASIGLEMIGMYGPKKAFKDILKRHGTKPDEGT